MNFRFFGFLSENLVRVACARKSVDEHARSAANFGELFATREPSGRDKLWEETEIDTNQVQLV